MSKILVVDRIENNLAVCEIRDFKQIIHIDVSRLPENIKDGTVLKFENGKFSIDFEMQEEIEKRIEQKMESVWE